MKRNQINFKKFIAKPMLVLSVILLAITGSAFLTANPDFSGEWKLNESKSTLGQFNRAAKTLNIKGDVTSMAINRVATNRQGEEVKTDEKLTFDDKEIESSTTSSFGTSKKKSKAKWSDDGKKLTVKSVTEFEGNGQKMEIKTVETWSLSDDAKTLTIESTSESTRGTNTTKMVYDKVVK